MADILTYLHITVLQDKELWRALLLRYGSFDALDPDISYKNIVRHSLQKWSFSCNYTTNCILRYEMSYHSEIPLTDTLPQILPVEWSSMRKIYWKARSAQKIRHYNLSCTYILIQSNGNQNLILCAIGKSVVIWFISRRGRRTKNVLWENDGILSKSLVRS